MEMHCERMAIPMEQTFTPSARDLRSIARNKLREEQATADENIATAKVIVPKMNPPSAFCKNIETSKAQVVSTRKLPSISRTQPELPHRAISPSENGLPPSLDGGLSSEFNTDLDISLLHSQRISNVLTSKKTVNAKINFPSSHSSIWSKIDTELQVLLPSIFSDGKIKKLSTSELSEEFDC